MKTLFAKYTTNTGLFANERYIITDESKTHYLCANNGWFDKSLFSEQPIEVAPVKKSKDYTLLLIGLILLIAALCSCNTKQNNSDRHFSSDTSLINARDYQVEVYQDSTVIWDGNRHVATIAFDTASLWDNAIMLDNQ